MSYVLKPVHKHHSLRTWHDTKDASTLERVRITNIMQSSRFEWYLNGVQIDGFKASQLLKDSH